MIYSEDAERIEAAIAGVRPTSTGWVHTACIFCGEDKPDKKRSLHVNPATGRYKCWRCGEWGRIRPQEDYGAAPTAKTTKDADPPMRLPDGFALLCGEDSWDVRRGWEYLVDERGIPEEAIKALGIGACPPRRTACSCCPDLPRCRWQSRVVAPHFVDGVLRGWVGRQWTQKPKYGLPYLYPPGMRRTLYNTRVLEVQTGEPALVVEGALDVAAVGHDLACAFFGSPAPMHLDEMKARARRPIAVVLDGDVPDKCLMFALQLQFSGLRAGAVLLPPRMDPDQVPRASLLSAARACIGLREGLKL